MKKVMRPRYYCDHCNKSGGSGHHMQNHERGCTLNPKRNCRMCNYTGGSAPLEELMEILPTKEAQGFAAIPEEVVNKLREAADGCPVCMMAAIRQRGLDVGAATGFNFTAECKQVWEMVNAEQRSMIGYVG